MNEGVHRFYDVISSAGCQLAQGVGVQALEIVQQLVAVLALEVSQRDLHTMHVMLDLSIESEAVLTLRQRHYVFRREHELVLLKQQHTCFLRAVSSFSSIAMYSVAGICVVPCSSCQRKTFPCMHASKLFIS